MNLRAFSSLSGSGTGSLFGPAEVGVGPAGKSTAAARRPATGSRRVRRMGTTPWCGRGTRRPRKIDCIAGGEGGQADLQAPGEARGVSGKKSGPAVEAGPDQGVYLIPATAVGAAAVATAVAAATAAR